MFLSSHIRPSDAGAVLQRDRWAIISDTMRYTTRLTCTGYSNIDEQAALSTTAAKHKKIIEINFKTNKKRLRA